jgi:hypothetical protein
VRPALDRDGDAVRRADVYTVDTAIIGMKDLDVWDIENRTLERKDRYRILQNLRNYVNEIGGVIDDCQIEVYPTAVSELYSPPRVTAKARSLGLRPGLAIDLDTGWDLSILEQQREAERRIEDEDPELLMMSPECKRFSQLQALNDKRRDPNVIDDEFRRARRHLRFCRRMARQRYDKGKGFAFEAPWSAGTWKEDDVKEMLSWPGVQLVRTDMCAHGMSVPSLGDGGIQEGLLNKKPTGILTNVAEIAEVLARARCSGNHRHGDLIGGTARQAQIYPDQFCKAILTGLRKHLERRGALKRVSFGVSVEATARFPTSTTATAWASRSLTSSWSESSGRCQTTWTPSSAWRRTRPRRGTTRGARRRQSATCRTWTGAAANQSWARTRSWTSWTASTRTSR